MRFDFDFEIERNVDWVKVFDKDGSILWESRNDDYYETGMEQRFESNTNSVEVLFHTDGSVTATGWRLRWGEYEQKS